MVVLMLSLDREQRKPDGPYFAVYNAHPCFWRKRSGKESFVLIFHSIIYLFIFRYLFLYYKGISALSFEYIMAQDILCNK